jgi:hypothetical protein
MPGSLRPRGLLSPPEGKQPGASAATIFSTFAANISSLAPGEHLLTILASVLPLPTTDSIIVEVFVYLAYSKNLFHSQWIGLRSDS